MSKSKGQPKTRSYVAIAAHQRNSAGAMGGGKRTKNRRERASVKRELRSYDA
jgi:hypothetical protein